MGYLKGKLVRNYVVETFANLIHESRRAGIMVTHDLRMCKYLDRVLQMQDGKLVQVIEDRRNSKIYKNTTFGACIQRADLIKSAHLF